MVPHLRETIYVYGAQTYLGQEIACLGRALGHQIIAPVDELPSLTEPWMHGVHWMTNFHHTDPLTTWSDDPPTVLIYASTALFDAPNKGFSQILFEHPRRLLTSAMELPHKPRFLYRSTSSQPLLPRAFTDKARQFEALLNTSPIPWAALRLPLLYGPERPDSVAAMLLMQALAMTPLAKKPAALRVETAALAMLRVALEPDRRGLFDAHQIPELGDILIAQGAHAQRIPR